MSIYQQKFQVINCLGTGTFGQVDYVQHKQNNQFYAVKIIPLNVEIGVDDKQIQKECQLLRQMDPRFVIKYYDDWLEMDTYYIQMESCLMNMETVIQRIQQIFFLDEDEEHHQSVGDTDNLELVLNYIRCRLFLEIIQCVDYLHQKIKPPIIHRDLKPQNILVVATDRQVVDNRFVKLCDFGLATAHEWSSMTHTSRAGTMRYMATEVLEGQKYNKMADVYSLGFVGQDLFAVDIFADNTHLHPMQQLIDLLVRMIDRVYNDRPSCTEILVTANDWSINTETVNQMVTNLPQIRHIFSANNQLPVNRFLNNYFAHHLNH